MQTVNLSTRALKAVSRFAPKSEVRYYLVGVKVEYAADRTILIATDGHRLAAHRHVCANAIGDPGELIVPLPAVAAAVKMAGKSPEMLLEIPADGQPRFVCAGGSLGFAPVDGRYPDWRRVMPVDLPSGPVAPVQINADYLGAFGDIARDLSRKPSDVRFFHAAPPKDPTRPAGMHASMVRIDGAEDFVGVVMPMYTREEIDILRARPDWV